LAILYVINNGSDARKFRDPAGFSAAGQLFGPRSVLGSIPILVNLIGDF
jgi:hypothetical protein